MMFMMMMMRFVNGAFHETRILAHRKLAVAIHYIAWSLLSCSIVRASLFRQQVASGVVNYTPHLNIAILLS